jgi:phenylacetate-CoA ligase
MIWNSPVECMPREDLKRLQDARLREVVERVYYNVPWYREKMQKRVLARRIFAGRMTCTGYPLLTKEDLRETYPFGMFAVP